MWNGVTPAQPCRCRRRSMPAAARSPLAPSRYAGVARDAEPSRQPTTAAAASPTGSTSRSKSPACTRTAAVTPAAVMAAARQAAVRAQPASRIG
jgi:hypothetical protein